MTKYKINRDQEPKMPSKEEVEKYKDFSRLSANYDKFTKRPKQPLYKNKGLFLAIIVIALMAYLLFGGA